MSGDVIGEDSGRSGLRADHALQKPFRISDVLSVLMTVISRPAAAPEKA